MDHEIPVRIVDNQEYMKVVRSLLEEGKEVPLVVTGNSMMPFLIDRRDQVLIKKPDRPLKKGDIAFFQRENGQYILHRIHFMRKDKKTGESQFFFIFVYFGYNFCLAAQNPDHLRFFLLLLYEKTEFWVIGRKNKSA